MKGPERPVNHALGSELRGMILLLILAASLQATPAAPPSLVWRQLPPLPDKPGVAGAFAGVSGGAMVVAGGANFPESMPWDGGKKIWCDAVFVLDHLGGQWRRAGKLPRPLGYGVSASYKNALICVGGCDSTRHYPNTFRLRWRDGEIHIESMPSLPIALANMGGALVDSRLYVVCGAEGPGEQRTSNRLFCMDLDEPQPVWLELDSLPGVPRLLAAGASHAGSFYVFGGIALDPDDNGKERRKYLRDAFCYREGRGWSRVADLPKAMAAGPSPAPVVGNHVLVLPGDDGSNAGYTPADKHPGFNKGILGYDMSLNCWSDAGEDPAPRATTPCVEWGGMFIVPSGEVRPGIRSAEVWCLISP